jgi:monofunctional biosynthetic peptidoglycan transglycosylase
MTATAAARIAAVLPLPKKRGAVAPKGFTRRYGNTIAARVNAVARDGLDACVYKGTTPPPAKAPPKVTKTPQALPGEEYETAKPLPPLENVVEELPPSEPLVANQPATPPAEPANSVQPPPEPTTPSNSLQ